MAKKSPSDLESQLEWYYVSTETLVRILIGVARARGRDRGRRLLLHEAGRIREPRQAGDRPRRRRARRAPAQQKDAALLSKELASADDMLGEARRDLASGLNDKASRTAVEVQSRAMKIIAGAGVKSSANVVDTAGDVKIQKANRNTWDTLRPSTSVGEGDFIKTGPNGTAEVLWNDGTMYRIRPETLFEVHGVGGGPAGANVKLVVGTTDVNTGEQEQGLRVDGHGDGEHRLERERGHGNRRAADEREQLRRLDDAHRQVRARRLPRPARAASRRRATAASGRSRRSRTRRRSTSPKTTSRSTTASTSPSSCAGRP